MWTDSQRKRFLDVLFRQCSRSQYKFVQDWFRERVPIQHLDFTTVLPRFLSLYIFSFLEPKSLCRCAQVSWTWKFLSEQVSSIDCKQYLYFQAYAQFCNIIDSSFSSLLSSSSSSSLPS